MRCTGRHGLSDCCATARVLPTCPRACAAPGAHTATRGPTATGSLYLFLCCALQWRTALPGHVPVAAVPRNVERMQSYAAIASIVATLHLRCAAVRGRRDASSRRPLS
jgi:hypothetical protein